jgi:hypothetical protein
VNERIQELAKTFGLDEQRLDLVCECGDASCTEQIRMTLSEYEAVRADPTHFAVYPGHETSDVEEVVATNEGYDVVRKFEGDPAALAEQTDPRG